MPHGPAKKKTEDPISLESKLWATADKLRGHLDAADYKHVVLGLIFLKYISDRFAQRHAETLAEGLRAEPENREHKIGYKQVHADFAFYESIQKNHSTIKHPYFTLTTLLHFRFIQKGIY